MCELEIVRAEGSGYDGGVVGRTIKEKDLGVVAHTSHPSMRQVEDSLGYRVRPASGYRGSQKERIL